MSDTLYNWVKAEDEKPNTKYLIREISTKKIVNSEITGIVDDNIYFNYGGIFSIEYYEWLKPVSSEEYAKKILPEFIAAQVMYHESLLQTNRELGEKIEELEQRLAIDKTTLKQ